jgi:cell division GTPase FtsZ
MQTVTGWTAIGYGRSEVPMFNLPIPLPRKTDFRAKSIEVHKGIHAMDEAMGDLSISCNPIDASRAMYLLSAPHKEMNMDLVKELGDFLRSVAPKATIRNGDYPREKTLVEVTLVLSGLTDVAKVREYYTKSTSLIPEFKRREEEAVGRLKSIEEMGKDLPSLLYREREG